MKKTKFAVCFQIFTIITLFSTLIFAQETNKKASAASSLYLISAKAGGVNYVSGTVTVDRNGKRDGYLKQGDEVDVGDKVSTDAVGKAEILLNPGSYIRLAGDSQFEFLSTSLDDLQIQVIKGSAIFEVIADKDFTVTVKLPNSKFYLISAGVFRVDVLNSGEGKISVWKGKAQVGDVNASVVKSGKAATQIGNSVSIDKFDRDIKGEFDNWSRERAKTIAKANSALLQRQMRQSLLSSFNNNSWNAANGYGLWVHDPFSRSFCFLPFGWGWSSPYGFGYSQSIWNYNPPPYMTGPIYQNQNLNNNNGMQNNGYNPPIINPSNGSGNPAGGGSNNVFNPPVANPNDGGRVREDSPRIPIVERKGNPIDN